MAVSSIAIARKNQERRREKAVEAARNNAEFVKDILKRHNLSKTQTLKFEEVRSWLQMVGNAHAGTLPPSQANNLIDQDFPGTSAALASLHADAQCPESPSTSSCREQAPQQPMVVGDDEVEWVFMMAMGQRQKGSFRRAGLERGGSVYDLELWPHEFEKALQSWLSYIRNKQSLDDVMRKYDADGSGRMDQEEVTALLTDLNGGVPPEPAEVRWVMEQAASLKASSGPISTPGLIKVISIWYTRDALMDSTDSDHDPRPTPSASPIPPPPAEPTGAVCSASCRIS